MLFIVQYQSGPFIFACSEGCDPGFDVRTIAKAKIIGKQRSFTLESFLLGCFEKIILGQRKMWVYIVPIQDDLAQIINIRYTHA